MDDRLRAQVFANLQLWETDDLIQIWRERDLDEWHEETFEIIESILIERLGHLPDPLSEVPTGQTVQRDKDEGSSEQVIQRAKQSLKRVKKYWEAEKLAKALEECELAIEIAPDFADPYYYRGMIYEDMGETKQAITDYLSAARLDPLNKNALESISRIERRFEHKYQQSDTKKHLDLALEYANNDESEKAIREIELAKRDMPEIALAYNHMGLILQSLGELEAAIEAYCKAIERNPRFYTARDNLANARLRLEEEKYHHTSNDQLDADPPELALDNIDDQDWENLEDIPPLPGWGYMDKSALLLSGWPGHRVLPGRSGYDPLDMDFECAHMQGRIIRMLLNRKFRTHNPVYLLLLTYIGCICCIPLIVVITTIVLCDWPTLMFSLLYIFYGIVGLAVMINIISSIAGKNPTDSIESDSAFF